MVFAMIIDSTTSFKKKFRILTQDHDLLLSSIKKDGFRQTFHCYNKAFRTSFKEIQIPEMLRNHSRIYSALSSRASGWN